MAWRLLKMMRILEDGRLEFKPAKRMNMMLKQFGISNKVAFAFLSISLLLCMDVALGSTLDVYVDYKGKPAGKALVYIDNDILLGQTNVVNGTLSNINISPGFHTIVAKWHDNHGQQSSGMMSFTAEPNTYTRLRVDLHIFPRNLGWIWQELL